MIINQPVTETGDLLRVTDNILRDAGMSIEDSGGKVTFAGKDPVRKTVRRSTRSSICSTAVRPRIN